MISLRNEKIKTTPVETRALAVARKAGVLRTHDLEEQGVPRAVLTRLCRQGRIQRVGRGLYTLPTQPTTEHHMLAWVARRIPHGIVCLLTALRFHGLTTQAPHKIWLAIDVKARKPHVPDMPLNIVRFSGKARTFGVETHMIDRVPVQITTKAKTVADCYKYRNKIGLDVALEALKDYLRQSGSRDELWRAAKVCRVTHVMRPYMEALT